MMFYAWTTALVAVLLQGLSGGALAQTSCTGVSLTATTERQELTSPNYPNKYDDNLMCSWTITTSDPQHNFITILFSDFKTERSHDVVRVVTGTRSTTYAGTTRPPILTSSGSSVEIHFKTDGSVKKKGWALKYWAVDSTCASGNHNCDSHALCVNTNNQLDCLCNAGYQGEGEQGTCTEVNECETGAHNCNVNANCTNTQGSFTCSCKAGYYGDGDENNCNDRNECAGGAQRCDPRAVCTNTNGSFYCTCPVGFTGVGTPGSCVGLEARDVSPMLSRVVSMSRENLALSRQNQGVVRLIKETYPSMIGLSVATLILLFLLAAIIVFYEYRRRKQGAKTGDDFRYKRETLSESVANPTAPNSDGFNHNTYERT